jgi:hypothetical protein
MASAGFAVPSTLKNSRMSRLVHSWVAKFCISMCLVRPLNLWWAATRVVPSLSSPVGVTVVRGGGVRKKLSEIRNHFSGVAANDDL